MRSMFRMVSIGLVMVFAFMAIGCGGGEKNANTI